jgi:hypothetical protein
VIKIDHSKNQTQPPHSRDCNSGRARELRNLATVLEAHPDWFEVIHLYGTESGWTRLKRRKKRLTVTLLSIYPRTQFLNPALWRLFRRGIF